jgi:cation:H+ antiporter
MIFLSIVLIIIGFFLLVKGSDVMVGGAAGLAKHFRISRLVIGLTLIAFGTSLPEFSVSIISSLQNKPDLTVGNIIGSNIANIALILGIVAILKPIKVRNTTISRGIPLNIMEVLVFIILSFDLYFQKGTTGNFISRGDGLIFLLFFTIFLYYIYADLKAARVQKSRLKKKPLNRQSFPLFSFR